MAGRSTSRRLPSGGEKTQPADRGDCAMIVVFSLMRRREAIDVAAFNQHWLDPHGTLVCRFPRLRRYSQNRIVASPATSPAAQRLDLDGIAELAYDTDADQEAATQSPAMAACDRDSPAFIGAVVR